MVMVREELEEKRRLEKVLELGGDPALCGPKVREVYQHRAQACY